MFWKNIAWSLGVSEGDDDDDDDGGAYLLAADIRKTPDVSPDLNCTSVSSSNNLSNTTNTTAAGPKDWTKVQIPDLSPDLININQEHLPGDSICRSVASAPYTDANQEAKWKSNQWLVVSHMTLFRHYFSMIFLLVQAHTGSISLVGVTPAVFSLVDC